MTQSAGRTAQAGTAQAPSNVPRTAAQHQRNHRELLQVQVVGAISQVLNATTRVAFVVPLDASLFSWFAFCPDGVLLTGTPVSSRVF